MSKSMSFRKPLLTQLVQSTSVDSLLGWKPLGMWARPIHLEAGGKFDLAMDSHTHAVLLPSPCLNPALTHSERCSGVSSSSLVP